MENLPPLSFPFLRREHSRIRDLLMEIIGEDRESDDYKQFKKITVHILEVLNSFTLDENGKAKTRDQELDENGKEAFILSHLLKVAHLAFKFLPKDFNALPLDERRKLEDVKGGNLRETAITAFLHDFIEDVFDGDFIQKDPKTKITAGQIVAGILSNPTLDIPAEAQEKIWERIKLLTKPPQRYSHTNKKLTENDEITQYLDHYEEYLENIIKSGDAITQYIKFMDILQNAQSQKEGGRKRKEKAKLQANFIEKTFPALLEKLMKENPKFFKQLKDKYLFVELEKIRSKNKISNVIAKQNS